MSGMTVKHTKGCSFHSQGYGWECDDNCANVRICPVCDEKAETDAIVQIERGLTYFVHNACL